MDWNRVRAFLETVEHGSLSAAARRLGLTQPTLSRQVAALERDLGVSLFERVGKSLSLTQAGARVLDEVRAMGTAASRLSLIATSQSQSPEGRVRISASDIVAVHLLPPMLERLHEAWPAITIDVIASNEISDLMRREADIAIRHVQPEPGGLIAKQCRDQPVRLYAASTYLDRAGRPRTPSEVAAADLIGFVRDPTVVDALNQRGIPVTGQSFGWQTNNILAAWGLLRQGLGIGIMFEAIADAEPGIERVLPRMKPIIAPTWLATHPELHTSRRIRVVFDFLLQELS